MALTAVTFGDLCKTACAEDRYNSDVFFDRSDDVAADRSIKKSGKDREHLREGTRIPPRVGQIVMLGRRWAFVPASQGEDNSDDVVQLPPQRPAARAVGYNTRPRPTRLGVATHQSVPSQPAAATLVSKDAIFDRERNAEIPHIILTENLMLQRIVEAIRADATDDKWMVSGEVTEFFNENRLTIRTAQRANAN